MACVVMTVRLYDLFPQGVDGCPQPPDYASRSAEKVRQLVEQAGKSNRRYSNLDSAPLCPPDTLWCPLKKTWNNKKKKQPVCFPSL